MERIEVTMSGFACGGGHQTLQYVLPNGDTWANPDCTMQNQLVFIKEMNDRRIVFERDPELTDADKACIKIAGIADAYLRIIGREQTGAAEQTAALEGQLKHVLADNERMRKGEEETKQLFIDMFVSAIAGYNDAVVMGMGPYDGESVLGQVKLLAQYTQELYRENAELRKDFNQVTAIDADAARRGQEAMQRFEDFKDGIALRKIDRPFDITWPELTQKGWLAHDRTLEDNMAHDELASTQERLRDAEERVALLEAEVSDKSRLCAWCTHRYPVLDTMNNERGRATVSAHIAVCPGHPMRDVESERDVAILGAHHYKALYENAIMRLDRATVTISRALEYWNQLDDPIGLLLAINTLDSYYDGETPVPAYPVEMLELPCHSACGDPGFVTTGEP